MQVRLFPLRASLWLILTFLENIYKYLLNSVVFGSAYLLTRITSYLTFDHGRASKKGRWWRSASS